MFVIMRSFTLLKHRNVIADMTSFPSECSSWAENDGCTRIVWKKDGCVRGDTIA